MAEHVTSTSWVLFFKVLSVNKIIMSGPIRQMSDQKEDLKGHMSSEESYTDSNYYPWLLFYSPHSISFNNQ